MALLMSGTLLVFMGLMLTLTAGNERCHCHLIYAVGAPMIVVGVALLALGLRRGRPRETAPPGTVDVHE
jgi:hypothetical protein